MAIDGIGKITNITAGLMKNNAIEKDKKPFSHYLTDALNETNKYLLDADQLSEAFAAGKTDDIHQVLIASEKASIALQYTIQIRTKILDAYNEIMRMQI